MKKQTKKRKLAVILVIMTLLVVQTLPVFFPRPLGSQKISDNNIILYYQAKGEQGAIEVFTLLKEKAEEIRSKMNVQSDKPTKVFLYQSQFQLAIREAGLITMTFAPSWHIGDSHNGNIMMVSPYTIVKGHTHETILNATLHELVHSIVFTLNSDLPYFWDNGLATYLSAQEPTKAELGSWPIPAMNEMHTENGLTFSNMGGYAYSYKYIEFLDKTYGWEKVLEFSSGSMDYSEVFGKTEKELYDEWCCYMNK
ncbi:MAG: hypothetical protein JXQ23_01080 [Clostridia bacterium]|nr:hypothetical protein [Clostridia bacterium]